MGEPETAAAALLRAEMQREGGVLEVGDALIAGTVKVNGLAVAIRNIRDFSDLGVESIDLWL